MKIFSRQRIFGGLTAWLTACFFVGPALASAAQNEARPWRDAEGIRAAAALRKGVNLGNAWEAPPGTWGDRSYGEEDFRAIRRAGFDHVRVPVAWHHYMGAAPAHVLQRGILKEIGALVALARRERLAVVLTWHHFDRFTDMPDEDAIAQWHAGWKQIAAHYRRVPARALVFELINEPRDAATTERMNELYPAVIAVVRAVDARRTLLVSPGDWGSLKAVPELRLPRELTNVVATGHCYEPFLFTHQGASWTGALTRTTGIVYPGPPAEPVREAQGTPEWVGRWVADHNTLPAELNPSGPAAFAGIVSAAADWARREGRAVYVGEFGAITSADQYSRIHYATSMREELERHGFGWAWWDWKANFALARDTPEGVRADDALGEALAPRRAGEVTGTEGGRRGYTVKWAKHRVGRGDGR